MNKFVCVDWNFISIMIYVMMVNSVNNNKNVLIIWWIKLGF